MMLDLRLSRRTAARVVVLAALFVALAAPAGAGGARIGNDLTRKLDPSLATWAAGGTDSLALWVGFTPRDDGDPGRLAADLAAASATLTPRARARRLRARVTPLVDEHDLPVEPAQIDALRALGFSPFAVSRWFNRAAVRITPAQLPALAALAGVASIAPVPRAFAPPRPDRGGAVVTRAVPAGGRARPELLAASPEGLATGQLAQIGVTDLHAAGFTGNGVVIAILDEGFNFTWKHDALRGRVFPPGYMRDFVEGDWVVSDTTQLTSFEHGTLTLGCLAADLPGVYQGSGYGATVALARTEVHSSETPVEMLYWSQAAEWADSLGADLITSSVGYNRFDSPFPSYGTAAFDGHTTDVTRAAEIAASKGILLVNSVGNGGVGPLPTLVGPADMSGDSLIAVGAVDTFANVASFSSRGPTADGRIKPDLVARGEGAWVVNGRGLPSAYGLADGTSLSAPLIAGLAACLMEARPELTPVEIVRALRETATQAYRPDNDRGSGLPWGPKARAWIPGPPGVNGPPRGYVDLGFVGANPVRPARAPLRLRFGLGHGLGEVAQARLRVYDASGRVIQQLFHGSLTSGLWQSVEWNGRDRDDRAVKPGIYFVHLDAEGRTRTLRVALLE